MKVFFSAGEPSGDLHGANLIHELRTRRADVEAVGYGGPRMAAAGCDLHADLTSLAVMWFLRALLNLHKFLDLAARADRYFRRQRPDAVVLIDFPGFNWWIARRAKAHGIPVFYYAPPQIWAWASWRVAKMRRLVDHVLAALPFEARWLNERGCRATFVGHPYFDELERQPKDAAFLAQQRDDSRPLLVILPGSRNQEIAHNLNDLLRAARHVTEAAPQTRLAVAAFKPAHAEAARREAAALGLDVQIFSGRTPELIELSTACLAVSGSVSLELLCQAKPTVILYRVSPLAYAIQSWFKHVKYITLVNLLATDDIFVGRRARGIDAEPLFPEYLTCRDRSRDMAQHVIQWLTEPESRERLVARLVALNQSVGQGGACGKAVDVILREAAPRPKPRLRPHYRPPTPGAFSKGVSGQTAPSGLASPGLGSPGRPDTRPDQSDSRHAA